MQPTDDKTRQQTTPYVPDADTNPPATAPDRTQPSGGADGPRFGPPAAPGEIGTLGRFRIKKELGRGGMGAVYLALDPRLDRQLALKVMLPQAAVNQTAKDRFVREARAAARITHDNVIAILDADEIDGVPFIALPFLQGYPLDQYLKKKGNPAIPQVLRIGREIALGLAAAHDLGVVHRDVKPGNIWLEAPNGRVKILDFGLAKPQDEEAGGKELTHSGAVMGTPAYMAPEQAAGLKVDHRADLYSLGTVLYRLVAGKTPFERSGGMMALLTALAIEAPPRVEEFNADVPPALAELIHQLLEKNRDLRPQSAKEVAKRLAAIRDNRGTSGPDVSLAPVSTASQPNYVAMPVTVASASAFADLDDDEPTERERRTVASTETKKPNSIRRYILYSVIAVFTIVNLMVFIAKGVFTPSPSASSSAEKKPEKPATEPPKTTTVVGGSTKGPAVVPKAPAEIKYVSWTPVSNLTSVNVAPRGPLDDLDPAKFPASERFPWQPKELVAVAGSPFGLLQSYCRFTPDRKRLVMMSHNQGVRIFETDTLKLVYWDRNASGGWSLAVSPDGGTLAACLSFANGIGIQTYDLTGPAPVPLRRLAIGGNFYDMEFVDDGRSIVTLDPRTDKGIRRWDINDSAGEGSMLISPDPGDAISHMSLAGDRKSIAVLHYALNRTVQMRVWDLDAGTAKERCRLSPTISSNVFALSTDGRKLMTANAGKMTLWDVSGSTPKELETIDDPDEWYSVSRGDRTKNECYLLSNKGKTGHWSFETKLQKLRDLPRNTVAVSGDGQRSLQNDDASIHKVRDAIGNVIAYSGEAVAAHNVAPALGKELMTFFPPEKARLWTVRDGALQPEMSKVIRGTDANPFLHTAASPDGLAVAALDNGRLVAFKVIGTSLWPLTESTHGKTIQFAWASDSKSIVLVNDQNVLYRWNPHETDSVGEKLLDLGYAPQERIGHFQVSPNGQIVAVAGPRGAELIDLANPKQPRRTKLELGTDPQQFDVGAFVFSPGNRFLYFNLAEGPIRRLDLSDARLETTMVVADAPLSPFRFDLSADGRILVETRGLKFSWYDATVEPFQLLGSYTASNGVTHWRLAPDGRHLLIAENGAAYVLRLRSLDGAPPPAGVPTPPPAPVPAPAPAPPKALAKWLELTDGQSLAAWDQFQTKGWSLKSNMLEADGSAQGWVGTKKEYGDFEFEFEFRLPPRGNSGVFLRAWDNGHPTGAEFVEIQLLDDAAYLPMTVPNTRHGAVFKKVAPNPVPPFKLNQWNKGKIEVVGKHVTVTIGGVKCVDADVEFPRMTGRVGLQQFRTSAEFRNVRIREK